MANSIQVTEAVAAAPAGACDHGLSAVLPAEAFAHLPEPLRSSRGARAIPFPALLEGQRLAVLRCGEGFDAFVMAKLVGPNGHVTAFDTDAAAVGRAESWVPSVAQTLGYSNITFIARPSLAALPADNEAFDVVVSGCALSFWSEPQLAFEEIRRVLKPGGEFMLSEVLADRRVPRRFRYRPQYSKCLSQAVYLEDLRRAMFKAGFADVRTAWQRRAERLEQVRFTAATLRGFNIPLEDRCEDYGQFVVYQGSVPGFPESFELDQGHVFKKGETHRVCKNTADMLRVPRYAAHFEVSREHFHAGMFDCGPGAGTSHVDAEDDAPNVSMVCGPGCC